ncbi:MAG TPA: potassium-transporting ATPase subunit C [Sporichthyaceae bacterium]|jgi:K+-transporting ATPase ATPase C chain
MRNQFQVPPWARTHLAAVRTFAVLTALLGLIYPVVMVSIAQAPGLHHRAEGSLVVFDGKTVGSALLGQNFTDKDGNPLPQYFQPRPSNAGKGYDPTSSGAGNLGPEDIADIDGRTSLLTTICGRAVAVATFEGLPKSAAARPYCTPGGVGAVLAVFGPRDSAGRVAGVDKVISVNEACPATPFLHDYRGVTVQCEQPGTDVAPAVLVAIRGNGPADPVIPPDAVTASGSGLDPQISPAYARLQADRIATQRGMTRDEVLRLIAVHTTERTLGFMGEPAVNVLELNTDLDRQHPVART